MSVPDRALLYGEEIARCKEDFLYFCENYLKILDRNSKLVSFKLKPAQLALLKSLEGNPWQVVLKARQMGSSTLVAAYFFWKTLFTPNERSIIVAHTHDAVKNIYRIYQNFYNNLPKFLQFSTTSASANEIVFFHGGTIRVASATSQNFRGATYNNIHASEVAFWKDLNKTTAGLFQTAAGNSSIIIETTANGLNQFHATWADEENGFNKTFISWTMEPDYVLKAVDIEPTQQLLDYAEEWGLSKPQLWWAAQTLAIRCNNSWPTFLQEYAIDPLTCFVSSGDRFFKDVYPHAKFESGYRCYVEPSKWAAYTMGVDTASGSAKGDYSSFVVIDVTNSTRKIVATYAERVTPLEFAKVVYDELKKWNATAVVESNSYGLSVIEYLKHQEYERIYTKETYDSVNAVWNVKLGYNTNSQTRPLMLAVLQSHINSGVLVPDDERLRAQMNTFVYSAAGRPDHMVGTHDDMIIACALALMGADQAIVESYMEKLDRPTSMVEMLQLEMRTGKRLPQLDEEGVFNNEFDYV
jgi:hypothetical protein